MRPEEHVERLLAVATERLEYRAEESLEAMRAQLGGVERLREMVVEGQAWDALRDVAHSEAADLLVVGSHGGRRLAGIALGGTATELLHASPCSVLVARPPFDPGAVPVAPRGGRRRLGVVALRAGGRPVDRPRRRRRAHRPR